MSVHGFVHGFVSGAVMGALAGDVFVPGTYYASISKLITVCGGRVKFDELFDLNGDGVADDVFVEQALRAANADIDQYAAKRFHVPFATVTDTISDKAAECARLRAESWRAIPFEGHEKRWEAMYGSDNFKPGWLLQLGKGMVTPGADPMPLKHSTMAVDSAIDSLPAERDISRDKLAGVW